MVTKYGSCNSGFIAFFIAHLPKKCCFTVQTIPHSVPTTQQMQPIAFVKF